MVLHPLLILLLSFYHSSTCSFTKNILVTTPWKGGHFSYLLNIAATLADSGHNVTFLALLHDPDIPVPGNIRYLVPTTISQDIRGLEYLNEVAVTSGALDGSSEKLISRSITGNSVILGETLKQIKLRFDYFFGAEMRSIMENTQFDLIVVEETIFHPIAVIARKHSIPLVTAISVVDQQRAKHEQNLPALLTSEASQFLNIQGSIPPTFLERIQLFVELGSFVFNLVPGIMDIMAGYLAEEGLNGLTDLDNMTQLYLVNDHPALSFPYLRAPNSLNIAGIGSKNPFEPLGNDVSTFVESAKKREKHIIYVNLGTSAFSLDHYQSMFGEEFFETLQKSDDAVIIVRSDVEYPNLANVLSKPWLPQRALLASSTVSLFISSCGNNAKIESVLYKVPLLCIPLFTDQYFNSLLVKRNNFGEMLLKEDFSHEALEQMVTQMLENGKKYIESMHAGSSAVLQNPATPEDNLVFHCNHLMEFGNLNFLRNEVIGRQTAVEIYNLDILAAIFVAFLAALILVWTIGKKVVNLGWTTFKQTQGIVIVREKRE